MIYNFSDKKVNNEKITYENIVFLLTKESLKNKTPIVFYFTYLKINYSSQLAYNKARNEL